MNPKAASRKSTSLTGARSFILALSITATLALWAVFSKIERDAAAAVEPLPMSIPAPTEAAGEVVLNLPPIPTLIPTLDAQTVASPPVGGLQIAGQPTPIVPLVIKPAKIISRDDRSRTERASPPRGGERGSGGSGGGGGGGGGSTGSS